jgi:hypothetical protein
MELNVTQLECINILLINSIYSHMQRYTYTSRVAQTLQIYSILKYIIKFKNSLIIHEKKDKGNHYCVGV